jgi:hypothetical protein
VSVSEQAPEGYSGRSFGDEESMVVGGANTEAKALIASCAGSAAVDDQLKQRGR